MRQTCLYVSTKIGDLLDDLVVVGGLVPSLLTPDEFLPAGEDVHIGTMDLDLGLSLAILDKKRYEDLTQRLHRSGFEPDENEEGNTTFQRWKVRTSSGLKEAETKKALEILSRDFFDPDSFGPSRVAQFQ